MPSNKRAKELARAKHERQRQRRTERRARRRRIWAICIAVVMVLAIAATVVILIRKNGGQPAVAASGATNSGAHATWSPDYPILAPMTLGPHGARPGELGNTS